MEPLEIPDVRTSVGFDVGVNVKVHVGEVIGVGVSAGYDLGYVEYAVVNILQPLINKTHDRVKEDLYGVHNYSEILESISGGMITGSMIFFH